MMPHYHSDRQAVLCPRPPPPMPPDCRGNPRTPAVSRTSLVFPFFLLKTDLIWMTWIEFYILGHTDVKSYLTVCMMRCMALVSMMMMKSTNWRVKSLASSIFFSIVLISALSRVTLFMPASEAHSWLITSGNVSMSWSIDDDNHLFNKRHTRPPSTAARCSGFSQCYELLGMHELTLKLKPFFHTSHIIFLISWKSIRVLLELKYT